MMQNASAGLAADPAFRFPTPHSLMPSAPGAAALGGVAYPATFTQNPMLQGMISRAITEARSADKQTRQLMQIDIAAKQLALQIAEYEELMGGQDQSGGLGPGQQVMDDSGA